jgi:hypothetical protein
MPTRSGWADHINAGFDAQVAPDFVQLSCSEIRYCGASNFQIARKLQAMLLGLMHELPQYRAGTSA